MLLHKKDLEIVFMDTHISCRLNCEMIFILILKLVDHIVEV